MELFVAVIRWQIILPVFYSDASRGISHILFQIQNHLVIVFKAVLQPIMSAISVSPINLMQVGVYKNEEKAVKSSVITDTCNMEASFFSHFQRVWWISVTSLAQKRPQCHLGSVAILIKL